MFDQVPLKFFHSFIAITVQLSQQQIFASNKIKL